MKQISLILLIFLSISFSSFKILDQPISNDQYLHVKGPKLDFELVNKTGYDISDVYVAPSKEREWGDDVMGKDILPNGESVEISFSREETEKLWDVYVTWVGYDSEEDVFWTDLNLSKISKVTLYYDAKTNKTWAETE
jgi:hypothetical protein